MYEHSCNILPVNCLFDSTLLIYTYLAVRYMHLGTSLYGHLLNLLSENKRMAHFNALFNCVNYTVVQLKYVTSLPEILKR